MEEIKMKSKIYNFYCDPGHAWVKVPRTELDKLGIADKISSYSYQRGDHVYLEEDCDLYRFMEAMETNGVKVTFRDHVSNKSSRIRNYDRYSVGV